MEHHQLQLLTNYMVVRNPVEGKIYKGDCSGLAYWYTVHMNCLSGMHDEGVIIHVNGGFHETFGFDLNGNKNPNHITVMYEYAGTQSPKYHMSIGSDGYFYNQSLTGSTTKKKKKKKKTKRHKKKR